MALPPLPVGRDGEFRFRRGVRPRRSRTRRGTCCCLGEASVGKSVLLDTAAEWALTTGASMLRAEGAQFETGVSFSLLSQLFHSVLGTIRSTRSSRGPMTRLSAVHAAALRKALGWSDGPTDGPLMLSNAAVALIREAAAERPVLMVLDDLNWADSASATVLGFVARRLSGLRAGANGSDSPRRRWHIDRAGLPILEIGPLDEAASATLLTSRFPALAPGVRRRLLAERGGTRWPSGTSAPAQ